MTTCPCSDIQLCKPISGPPVNRQHGELYGFYSSSPNQLDSYHNHNLNFTYITTLAWATGYEIMCLAHEHKVRVILAAPTFDLQLFYTNTSAQKAWILSTLDTVIQIYYDGIVFDFEEPISKVLAYTYLQLIQDTKTIFAQYNPSYQISVCVPWSPDGIDGRIYPYLELSYAVDLIYVMMYDMQSQIWNSPCIANANSPLDGIKHGISRYLDLGVDTKKMILGVPWYGYRYTCVDTEYTIMKPTDRFCPIQKTNFRNVSCTDAVGNQLPFHDIRRIFNQGRGYTNTGGRKWDTDMEAPFFNEWDGSDSGITYQYWYDDAQSLRSKFEWAKSQGLAGVGPFAFSYIYGDDSSYEDPRAAEEDARDMWSAFDSFFQLPHRDWMKFQQFQEVHG